MQFLITAYDGSGMLEKRMAVRPRHLENISRVKGKILCAGGLLDAEGKMKGSVLIIDFAGREFLDEYLKSEPYIMEKVWERVEVEPMNVVVLNGEMQQAPKAAEKKPARGFFDRCEEIEDRAVCKKSDVKFYPDK